jgi:hypothetical protein
MALSGACASEGEAQSILLDTWTDYLARAEAVKSLDLTYGNQTYSQRWQWGSADPGLPQTSSIILQTQSPTLIMTQQFSGQCKDLYLEYVSENPLNELGDSDMQAISYTIEHPQRIGEEEVEIALSVFPNPTADVVTLTSSELETGTYSILVEDMQGRRIMEKLISIEAHEKEVSIDLRELAQGSYAIQLVSSEGVIKTRAMRVLKQ